MINMMLTMPMYMNKTNQDVNEFRFKKDDDNEFRCKNQDDNELRCKNMTMMMNANDERLAEVQCDILTIQIC